MNRAWSSQAKTQIERKYHDTVLAYSLAFAVCKNALVDAEVMVGKTVVYTGANGEFELTLKRSGRMRCWLRDGGLFQGRVHAVRYEQGGCMLCTRSDTPHGGLAMCTRCYSREFQFRKRILRKLIEASDAGKNR